MDDITDAPVDKTETILSIVGFIGIMIAVNTAAYIIGDLTGRALIKLMFPEPKTTSTEGSAE